MELWAPFYRCEDWHSSRLIGTICHIANKWWTGLWTWVLRAKACAPFTKPHWFDRSYNHGCPLWVRLGVWQTWSHWVFAVSQWVIEGYYPPLCRWDLEQLNSLPIQSSQMIRSCHLDRNHFSRLTVRCIVCRLGVWRERERVLASTFLPFTTCFQGLSESISEMKMCHLPGDGAKQGDPL